MDRRVHPSAVRALMLAAVALVAACERPGPDAQAAVQGGDPARAPQLMRYYGCAACHEIPGVPGATGRVGPPLKGLRDRAFIGGVLSNNAENLVRWIQDPQKISPRTAMPQTGITEADARHVAAYLYSR